MQVKKSQLTTQATMNKKRAAKCIEPMNHDPPVVCVDAFCSHPLCSITVDVTEISTQIRDAYSL
jgi:hypothetical protein